ncbi:MAG: hypothetical protein PHE09_06420 [Oscillospiraceae bacterium]|nr:hypothetical protein [Oscillospiraceae bacterium]
MYDFHSHILPEIDDGSRSIVESLDMLRESFRQGITHIAATPHFYADHTSPDVFLEKRRLSWNSIEPYLESDMPRIKLGAEVHYYEGLCCMDNLHRLCIEETKLLLLEMPLSTWSTRLIGTLIGLNGTQSIQILLAHFERYLPYQPRATWEILRQNGILLQANAEFFIKRQTRRAAIKAMQNNEIYLLGSDCHNMKTRKPNLGEATEIIKMKMCGDVLDTLNSHGWEAFNEVD